MHTVYIEWSRRWNIIYINKFNSKIKRLNENSHDFSRIPEDSIIVKILGGVEPKVEFHLSPYDIPIPTPSDVHICL